MKFTWTQKFILGNLATKYIGRHWGNYEDISIRKLFISMVRQGASVIEMGAMTEQFEEFRVLYKRNH